MKKSHNNASCTMTNDEESRIVRTLGSGSDKYYVYALCKRDGTPFYIGKGCGRRILQHGDAARQAKQSILSDNTLTRKEKDAKIGELTKKLKTIIDQSDDLRMVIVKWGLTDSEALMCESALINILEFTKGKMIGELTNLVNGHASEAEKGSYGEFKTKARDLESFLNECAIRERSINCIREKVVFIKINKLYSQCIDQDGRVNNENVKECVRGIWTIGKNMRNKIQYVFALFQNRVVGVFRVLRVSDDIGVEYRSGLEDFPEFPADTRDIDRKIARFASVEEAAKALTPKLLESFKEALRERETPKRYRTENEVLSYWRRRVYFILDDRVPKRLAKFKGCLLKKDDDAKFFKTQKPLRFN